jgi:Importin-beta N-terminal domain
MPASFLPIPYQQVKYFVSLCVLRPSRPSASPLLRHTLPSEFSSSPLLLSDQATRENATQKLEQASRENYVRRTFYTSFHRTHHPHHPIPFFPLSLTHAPPLRTQPGYMHTLASELANEASPVFVRNAAGLALKNALTARVRRAVPPSSPRSPSSLTFLPGSCRTARVRSSTRPAGLASMPRSATRSKSLSCVVFTLNRSRPAQFLRRASRLLPPWNSPRANGQI